MLLLDGRGSYVSGPGLDLRDKFHDVLGVRAK